MEDTVDMEDMVVTVDMVDMDQENMVVLADMEDMADMEDTVDMVDMEVMVVMGAMVDMDQEDMVVSAVTVDTVDTDQEGMEALAVMDLVAMEWEDMVAMVDTGIGAARNTESIKGKQSDSSVFVDKNY